MVLRRSPLSSRKYISTDLAPIEVQINWQRAFGGFQRGGELRVDSERFELRCEKYDVWLMDGEESLAYARGQAQKWTVLIDEREFELNQPAFGKHSTDVTSAGIQIGQIRSTNSYMSSVLVNLSDELDLTIQAFFAAIAIRGWRETLNGVRSPSSGIGGG